MTTLYVGNLPFSATEDEVRGLFEQHGQVDSVKIVNDRETGRPRGFCFVDMPADDAQKAIAGLNGTPMNGPGDPIELLAGFFFHGHELVIDCAAIVARPCLAGCRPAPGLLSRNVFDQVTGIARALALRRAGVLGVSALH